MTEQTAARIVQQVLAGIQHCHDELGVVHRDLKPGKPNGVIGAVGTIGAIGPNLTFLGNL